ncbi:uncharacterized protein LOC119738248 [Patiria miniata]|uniref:PEHE domain-containing protein n=1 Tax=Patiria miniata TaxID=46514 RepID=A0A914AXV7_PATMI|nr:uncharacterized protein LOC119738248 [Patiria miniata]XP_038068979.1 uncharacterized protein LOC119738248 [Patiria miniata]XP_038068980.1 uncharacterized protein LOC119738248 [Patiria miniata]
MSSPSSFDDHKTYGVITNMNAGTGRKSASANELQRGSNSRRRSDSDLDHKTLLQPSPEHHSMINIGTESLLKTSYNIAPLTQERIKTKRKAKQRHDSLSPDLEIDGSTRNLDINRNVRSGTSNLHSHEETQKRKKHLDLRPIQRNSPYPLWKFSKSREPPETALDVAYRTILDYKQPITLHRQPKADRQMIHYDCLPSIKVFSEEHQQRREAMRYQLKQQLQLEDHRKRQEILEMEQDIIPESEREENIQKSIFLPSGEEYEFSEGDITMATLPVPTQRTERRSSTSSHHSSRSLQKSSSSTPVSSRRSSHDVGQANTTPLSLSVMPPSPLPSTKGSKRRHSVSTLVRREKMFSVVSHWPGMRPSQKLFEMEEPSPEMTDEDTFVEMPTPPPVHDATPVHQAHHRKRNSRMLKHAESKAV